MRIITRNDDNVVVMFSDGGKPEADGTQTAHDLNDAQRESFIELSSQPNGGVTFDGTTFGSLPAPAPPPPRAVCSKWQFRKELRTRNLLQPVLDLIAQQDEEVKEAFDFASEYWSDNPMLLQMAAALSPPLSPQEVYDMVVAASQRVVGVP